MSRNDSLMVSRRYGDWPLKKAYIIIMVNFGVRYDITIILHCMSWKINYLLWIN